MQIATVRRLARQDAARAAGRLGRKLRRFADQIEAASILHSVLREPRKPEHTVEQAIELCISKAWINTQLNIKQACDLICPQGYSARIIDGNVSVMRLEK